MACDFGKELSGQRSLQDITNTINWNCTQASFSFEERPSCMYASSNLQQSSQTIPGSSSSKPKPKRRRHHIPHHLLPAKTVVRRNARERSRVHAINAEYQRLKQVIPSLNADPEKGDDGTCKPRRVSKEKILMEALEYIYKLTDMLQTREDNHVAVLPSECEDTWRAAEYIPDVSDHHQVNTCTSQSHTQESRWPEQNSHNSENLYTTSTFENPLISDDGHFNFIHSDSSNIYSAYSGESHQTQSSCAMQQNSCQVDCDWSIISNQLGYVSQNIL